MSQSNYVTNSASVAAFPSAIVLLLVLYRGFRHEYINIVHSLPHAPTLPYSLPHSHSLFHLLTLLTLTTTLRSSHTNSNTFNRTLLLPYSERIHSLTPLLPHTLSIPHPPFHSHLLNPNFSLPLTHSYLLANSSLFPFLKLLWHTHLALHFLLITDFPSEHSLIWLLKNSLI